MKVMKSLVLLLAFLCVSSELMAQNQTEKIVKELSFSRKSPGNVLKIENIDGFVHVETHNSDKVLIEVERIIKPRTADGLEKSKELSLEFEVSGDSIISYLKAPYIQSHRTGSSNRGVNITKELGYRFTHNFTIKVPQNTNIALTTINNGDVKIKDLTASYIHAANVNGAILLDNISGDVDAKTVNGSVVAKYRENPKKQARLETLNGNVELLYRKSLSATISFSAFNGDFYTDLDDLQQLAPEVKKVSTQNGATTTYKLGKESTFKTGAGTALLYLKTFNGKVIVKAQS
ncbi:DUF4097 family beta strand repeat protein [Pontibacter sp. FD36]|uniref:DUF4097 family beta strand repeat-containing protein n=1 Tax=Pontibacter sp. FD36 TaxID=2789860 RepID=UPI0018A8B2CC|nr:DUF4097 family beta strand repeat-containing protein [Pontibacter sp. FD36]MBF8965010.1 DUF4097 family beta strand repeat protein [Pontibacter sp. FD36]